jgi:hypothetical protein
MYFSHAFLIALIKKKKKKKTCDSHMFKGHMSLFYGSCIEFPTNRFVGNLCSSLWGIKYYLSKTKY